MCAEVFHQWLLPVREGRLAASDTAQLFRESTPHLRRALKKVYAHDGPNPTPTPDPDPTPSPDPNPNPNPDPNPDPNSNQVYAHDGSEKVSAAAAIAPATLRLPTCAKYLLLAAHLASRFPARMDVALFRLGNPNPNLIPTTTPTPTPNPNLFSSIRRGAKQRRTKRNAAHDEPRPFTLERLLTTYAHIQPETELQPLRVEVRRRRGTVHPHPRTRTCCCTPLHVLAQRHSHPPHTLTPLTSAPSPPPHPTPITPRTPPSRCWCSSAPSSSSSSWCAYRQKPCSRACGCGARRPRTRSGPPQRSSSSTWTGTLRTWREPDHCLSRRGGVCGRTPHIGMSLIRVQ